MRHHMLRWMRKIYHSEPDGVVLNNFMLEEDVVWSVGHIIKLSSTYRKQHFGLKKEDCSPTASEDSMKISARISY